MARTETHRFTAAVVPAVAGLRAAFQIYEQYSQSGWFRLGGFIWDMMPYLLCLAVWARGTPYMPATAGVSVALAADLLAYHSALTGRDGQSGLILVFMPLWSTLIFCPIAIYLARTSAGEKDNGSKGRAP